MYAIIESGGKQYRVEKNDVIEVEKLSFNKEEERVEFDRILFLKNGEEVKIGSPYLAKSLVLGKCLGETKGPKVISFKYKQRKGVRRKLGHRQKYHKIKITEIIG